MCHQSQGDKTGTATSGSSSGNEVDEGHNGPQSPVLLSTAQSTTTTTMESSSSSSRHPSSSTVESHQQLLRRRRRGKRDRNPLPPPPPSSASLPKKKKKKKKRRVRHTDQSQPQDAGDRINRILSTLLPSLIGLCIGGFALMAKLGFRGRATVAGIDLGTTNSVICIQQPSKSVGEIVCIPDPHTQSPIIPSVVSYVSPPPPYKTTKPLLERSHEVTVGQSAKDRIDTHPHTTLYHAKRIIGRTYEDPAVAELREEAEFAVLRLKGRPLFHVPTEDHRGGFSQTPEQIGARVLTYLLQIASANLGHSSVKSAVIAIPAEFTPEQRRATIRAYELADIKVLRILEEPTAAALAYGLDDKEGVEHVLVYDFGGGTLDVSLLRMGKDGYVDVMGSAGDGSLGGVDFDHAVVRYLQNKGDEAFDDLQKVLEKWKITEEELTERCHQEETKKKGDKDETKKTIVDLPLCTLSSFHTMAERMKIGLSSITDEDDHDHTVTERCLTIHPDAKLASFQTEDACRHLTPHAIALSYNEYHTAVRHLYPRGILPIRKLLLDLDMTHDEIDEVVMVGGTTRMAEIRRLVKEELKMSSLNTDIDPDLTVAYGAASVID